jgi:hypothetical protein
MGSGIPAVENPLLATRLQGVDGRSSTLHPVVKERVDALFGILRSAQIASWVPLGYPLGRFGLAMVPGRPLGR